MKQSVLRFSRPAFFLASVLLFTGGAFAQTRGENYPPSNITGVVRKQTDSSIVPRIKVTVSTGDGLPVDTHYTNSDGSFAFGNLPSGQYLVTINEEGYQPYREEVTLTGFPGVRLNISLREVVKDKPALKGDVVSSRELNLPPKTQEALHTGIDTLFQKRDPAASLPFFQAVLDVAPTFYEANYYQGVAYLKLGKNAESEAAFRKAIASSQDTFADADFSLASILCDQGRYAEAEPIDRAGLKLQPDAWRGHYELARELLGTNRPSEAEQSALEARKRMKTYPQLYLLLANIHLRLLRNQDAIEDLDTYLKLDPSGPYSEQAKALKEKTEQTLGKNLNPPTH